MLLEIGKSLSFFLSLISLYPLMASAFFVPGSRWQERLEISLPYIALAACLCFASGNLFSRPSPDNPEGESLIGMAILFAVVGYLEVYYIPVLPHGCCRP